MMQIPVPILIETEENTTANSTNTAALLSPLVDPLTSHITTAHQSGSESASATTIATTVKRTPIKCGYLFKQSSGKWKRKRWNQRWFVLDHETGILKYFRHASLPETVPFRQDTYGQLQLKQHGVSLVIQGDLPRGVPTPFCFTISGKDHPQFRICADTNIEFQEWTSAISAVMNPQRRVANSDNDGYDVDSFHLNAAVEDDMHCAALISGSSDAESSPTSKHFSAKIDTTTSHELKDGGSYRPITKRISAIDKIKKFTIGQSTMALALVNPVAALIKFGSLEQICAGVFIINALCVWLLWFRESAKSTFVPSTNMNSTHEDTSFDENEHANGVLHHTVIKRHTPSTNPVIPSTVTPLPAKVSGRVNGLKVLAGTSVKMCAPAPDEIIPGCWTHIHASRFNVRQGPNYRKTKLKAPSSAALLDLVGIDVYQSDIKIDNVGSVVDLSSLKTPAGKLDLFIVNCQVPSYQPSNPLWGEKQGNGPGFNFITYFSIPDSVRSMLNEESPSHQAVQLLKRFLQEDSCVRERFKAIGIVVNPQEQRLGRTERHLLETYNGQPILTRPQHRFYEGEGYFEVDVDAHEFNYVARRGLVGVAEHFRNMIVDFGFVLEGQDDQELPEQILGSVRLCKIDVRHAPQIS